MSDAIHIRVLGEIWEVPDPAWADRWRRCQLDTANSKTRTTAAGGSGYQWTSRITIASIEARAGEWLMFHAAGVSHPDGGVAALIGPSGTGKSTAARTLCREHFGYVTDETVAVDGQGEVVPFPKPIAFVVPDSRDKEERGPDELGLLPCPDHLTLAALIVLERSDHYLVPEVKVLDLFDGLVSIIPDTSALPHLPTPLRCLAEVAEHCGGIYRIRYADAHDLVNEVHSVLTGEPVTYHARYHQGTGPLGTDPAQTAPDRYAEKVVRAQYTDALELDGEVLLLQGSSCLRLAGVGALAWLAADQPITMDEMLAEVVAAAGHHPEAEQLLTEVVDHLEGLGLLKRV